jgi:hypothetical protein
MSSRSTFDEIKCEKIITTGASTVGGATTFDSTVDFNGAVTVDGATTFNSTVDLNAAVTVDGAATFNSTVDLNGAVTVDGAATFNSTVDFNGSVNVDGAMVWNNAANNVYFRRAPVFGHNTADWSTTGTYALGTSFYAANGILADANIGAGNVGITITAGTIPADQTAIIWVYLWNGNGARTFTIGNGAGVTGLGVTFTPASGDTFLFPIFLTSDGAGTVFGSVTRQSAFNI